MDVTEQEEREANYFAMCLLMPEKMLRADLTERKKVFFDVENDPIIDELAKRYGVSVQLMTMRLSQLGIANTP